MLPKVKLLAGLSVITFALGCAGSAPPTKVKVTAAAPPAAAPNANANAVTTSFVVNRMECSGCEARIRRALREVNGIYDIEVKLTSHRVLVTFDKGSLSADTIASTITAAGYLAYPEI